MPQLQSAAAARGGGGGLIAGLLCREECQDWQERRARRVWQAGWYSGVVLRGAQGLAGVLGAAGMAGKLVKRCCAERSAVRGRHGKRAGAAVLC